ncbi:MAG TPA: hypothetical protein VFR35_17690 [Actinoplanes sp.]|nr:hypothetical protein [Actinoplanes sp.]
MSDFDAVLERLLADPSFAAALAADPDRALRGYRLDDGEADLLRTQVATDSAADVARVEERTTKSSTFGLFSSIGDWSGFGTAAGVGAAHAVERLGDQSATTGMGDAPDGWGTGGGSAVRTGLGDAPRTGLGEASHRGVAEAEQLKGYHNRVDADGDGDWDKAIYRARADGGVDLLVDLNSDGKADFIGHDRDRDWTVDSADYDKNHDGVFEKRMYDDNGDGLLDRSVWLPD